jgi:hypothetical protein
MLHRRPQAAFEQTLRLWTRRRLEARARRAAPTAGIAATAPVRPVSRPSHMDALTAGSPRHLEKRLPGDGAVQKNCAELVG